MPTIYLISTISLWILFLVLALAVVALYRHFAQLYINSPSGKQTQGPEEGSHLLSTSAATLSGEQVHLPSMAASFILFSDTTCTLCAELRDNFDSLDARVLERTIVFCSGREADVRAWGAAVPPEVKMVWDKHGAIANKYEVNGTPYAVLVDGDGIVRNKSIVNGRGGLVWAADELSMVDASLNGPANQLEETMCVKP